MSVQMKPGRWRAMDCTVHDVHSYEGGQKFCWCSDTRAWSDTGGFDANGAEHPKDLIEYLGPLSPTPASAEAGPAGDPVESAKKTLAMMRHEYNALDRWLSAYKALVAQNERTKDELEEVIKRLEKEVEG